MEVLELVEIIVVEIQEVPLSCAPNTSWWQEYTSLLGWQGPTSGTWSWKRGNQQELWNPRGGVLEISGYTFWLTLPLAFGEGMEARCPAMFGIVPYNEKLSPVPHAF